METINRIEYLESTPKESTKVETTAKPFVLRMVQFGFQTLGRLFPKAAAKAAYRLFSTPRIRARHKTSDALLESARLFEVLYGKTILKGYEWGQGEKTVLLVHGWESRGTAMRSFVPELVKRGYRVLAFDGPAHGDSGGKRTNLIHFAGAVRAFINYAGKVEAIIAHSFGGASSVFALSTLDPTIKVSKLVLIGVPNRLKWVIQDALDTMKTPKAASKHFIKIIEDKIQAKVREMDIQRAYDKMQVQDALIIHDKRDYVVPFSNAEAIHAGWPNSTLLIAEGYGHYRLMKNPELIGRVGAFVAEC